MTMPGEISRLNNGFGFIRVSASSRDVFFHRSALDVTGKSFDELAPGDPVEVEVVDAPKGPRADWVRCAR